MSDTKPTDKADTQYLAAFRLLYPKSVSAIEQAAIQAERERCAKIAHKLAYGSGTADAIRRGGEHEHNE